MLYPLYIDRSSHACTHASTVPDSLSGPPPRQWSRRRTRPATASAHATYAPAAYARAASTIYVADGDPRQGHHPPRLRTLLDFGGTAWSILVLLLVLALRWPAALRNWAERITPNKWRQGLLILPPAIYCHEFKQINAIPQLD